MYLDTGGAQVQNEPPGEGMRGEVVFKVVVMLLLGFLGVIQGFWELLLNYWSTWFFRLLGYV